MQKFYELEEPKSPWGDYSSILIKGMSYHSSRKDGLIQIERTGPYVPPISFPGIGDIVVTDVFRRQLESSGLTGLRFQPVIKKHIVHLDWQTWDQTAKEPAEYPQGGEPEGYVLDRPHSARVSDQIGDLWELLLEQTATVQRERKPTRILLVETSWRGADLFRAESLLRIYVTEKTSVWFEQNAPEHVQFLETSVI